METSDRDRASGAGSERPGPSSDAATGQVSATAAEIYQEFFVPALFAQWPARILDIAGLRTGDDVLDVGCGTGVLARAAVAQLGGSGSVTGIDANEGMLDVARRADDTVSWRHATAEALPFPTDSFDRVVSQFAAMFFSDARGALAEMARVARPGGSVTVATWTRVEESPGYAAMVSLLRRLFGDGAADALLAPFTIGTSDELDGLLSPFLGDVSVQRCEGWARFDSLDAWVRTDVRGWTLSDMIDDEQFELLLAAAHTELDEFVTDDGSVRFPAPALVGTATVA
jgi:SAM-dependent methyltransferase